MILTFGPFSSSFTAVGRPPCWVSHYFFQRANGWRAMADGEPSMRFSNRETTHSHVAPALLCRETKPSIYCLIHALYSSKILSELICKISEKRLYIFPETHPLPCNYLCNRSPAFVSHLTDCVHTARSDLAALRCEDCVALGCQGNMGARNQSIVAVERIDCHSAGIVSLGIVSEEQRDSRIHSLAFMQMLFML